MAIGLTVIKVGFRHGAATEEWGNKYHLTGTDPANPTAWRTLFDALVAQEKTLYTSSTKVVRGYGYVSDADDATAVWSVDLQVSPNTPVPGTLTNADGTYVPSDVATWVRWKLDRNNSNGKPVFLRKYFHDQIMDNSGGHAAADSLSVGSKAALNAFASLLFTGAGVGGSKIRDAGGGNVIASGISNYFTTRTLKRRGKRP